MAVEDCRRARNSRSMQPLGYYCFKCQQFWTDDQVYRILALLIGLRGSHPYEPIKEFIYGFNFNVEFEKGMRLETGRHIGKKATTITTKKRQPATKSFLLSKGDCFTGKTIFSILLPNTTITTTTTTCLLSKTLFF